MIDNFTIKDFFTAGIRSFYAAEPYRIGAIRPRRVFFLLALLTSVLALPGYISMVSSVMSIKKNYVDPLVYQLPVMEVINGKVESSAAQPFRLSMGDRLVFVLDTTGTVNSLEESGAWAYMGKDHFAMFDSGPGSSIRRFDLSDTDYMMLDPLSMKNWIDRMLPLLYPLVFIVTTAGIFLFRIVQMLAALGLAFFFCKITGRRGEYFDLLTVALFAMVPSMVIEGIIMWIPVYFAGKGLVFYLLLAGYMWWGVRSYLSVEP